MRLVPVLVFASCLPFSFGQAPLLFWSPPVSITLEAGATPPVTARPTLTNFGAAFSYVATSDQPWMTVAPASGTMGATTSQDFVVTIQPAQLPGGTWTGKITVTPAVGSGAQPAVLDVTVQLQSLSFVFAPPSLDFTVGPESTEAKPLTVTLSDGTSRPITATPVVLSGPSNWLTVTTPVPFNSNEQLQVRVSAAGLDPGMVLLGEVRFAGTTVNGLTGVVPVKLTVANQGVGFTVIPSQLNYYVFGTVQPPSQLVQVIALDGRTMVFDVLQSSGSAPLRLSISSGVTPTFFQAQMDTSSTPTLPREDSLTVTPRDGSLAVITPVKTLQEPARVNAIPQVADGGGFRTAITVVNSDSAPARVTLRFYKSDPATRATVPWTPPMEGNAPFDNIEIPVGSAWTVQTAGTSTSISSGWAEVVSEKRVSGLAVFRQVQPDGRTQEAAVPINSGLMQRNLLPFDNTNSFVTSVAIANLSTTELGRVRVAFRGPAGNLIRIDRLKDIPARGHTAFELYREFPYLQGLSGTADFWVLGGHISVLGLRFSPSGAFTSFEAQSLNSRPSGRKSIPQVADGGEFRTAITLVNNDATPAQVRLRFWKDAPNNATEPWTIAFEGGVNPDQFTIPPGNSITLRTSGVSPTVLSGWAEVLSDQYITGFAVFRRSLPGEPDQEAAVPVNAATPFRSILPFDLTRGFTTSIAVANLSANVRSEVFLTFRDAQGQRLLETTLPELPLQGHKAFDIFALYPALKDKSGAMEISVRQGEISILGLRFAPTGAFTSFRAQPIQ